MCIRDRYNGFDHPNVVFAGTAQNSVASGWAPIGSHMMRLSLEPGEERSLIFVLGYCENPEEEKWESPGIINKAPAKRLMEAYQTDAQVDAALTELAAYWDALLSKYRVASGDEKLDRMVNIWNCLLYTSGGVLHGLFFGAAEYVPVRVGPGCQEESRGTHVGIYTDYCQRVCTVGFSVEVSPERVEFLLTCCGAGAAQAGLNCSGTGIVELKAGKTAAGHFVELFYQLQDVYKRQCLIRSYLVRPCFRS